MAFPATQRLDAGVPLDVRSARVPDGSAKEEVANRSITAGYFPTGDRLPGWEPLRQWMTRAMQMRVYSVVTLVMALGLVACEAKNPAQPLNPSEASLDHKKTEETIPIEFVVTNPCNGDEVLVSGVLETVSRVSSKKDETIEKVRTNIDATAVGLPSGAEYNVSLVSREVTRFSEAGVQFISFEEKFTLISKGAEPNFFMTTISTFRVGPDGLEQVKNEVVTRCKGVAA